MMNGPQHQALTKLITRAFNSLDLQQLTKFAIGENLFNLVPPGNPHQHTVFLLLEELERQGLLTRCLRAAMAARPENFEIQEGIPGQWPQVLVTLPPGTVQKAGATLPAAVGTLRGSSLERIVRDGNPALDIARWRSRLGQLEVRVCRVDINGAAQGTGFLIGPQLVLTNHHVVENVLDGTHPASSLSCLFDHKIQPDGSLADGDRVFLKDGAEILLSAPCTAAETTNHPDADLPRQDQQDFAVLQLDRAAGGDEVHGMGFPPRGFEILPDRETTVATDDGLVIAQHPMGEPMKLAIDTQSVIGYNANKTRLRYRTNTEGGSSGSPVFNMKWELVALHHLGDPAYNAIYNQGIAPLHLIRKAIAEAGYGGLLG